VKKFSALSVFKAIEIPVMVVNYWVHVVSDHLLLKTNEQPIDPTTANYYDWRDYVCVA
jgi:hypothetical protein